MTLSDSASSLGVFDKKGNSAVSLKELWLGLLLKTNDVRMVGVPELFIHINVDRRGGISEMELSSAIVITREGGACDFIWRVPRMQWAD